MSDTLTKELWVKLLCAWNNVPCDNKHMARYADAKWSPSSQEGWRRVADAAKKHFRIEEYDGA